MKTQDIKDGQPLADATCSAFLRDVVEARRLWGDRTSWVRDERGECKADRVWKGLMWSAAHEGMLLGKSAGGEWSERKQAALEAAQIDYEKRSVLSLFMPNAQAYRPADGQQEGHQP